MDAEDRGAGTFLSNNGQVPGGTENPLWAGNTCTEEADVALDSAEGSHHGAAQCVFNGVTAPFAGAQNSELERQPETVRPTARKNYQQRPEATVDEQTSMMNAYVEKFSPLNPPAMGYYASAGPSARRLPPVLPEIDLSYRPGSLQEAICMYIDFLMAENEVRTRISECAVASPAPPLDFHREEYYRDVMCRPVNFPTSRFRDWLKRYNVDIEITDPDGQTVSQTTFAPVGPVSECAVVQSTADAGDVAVNTLPQRRRMQRASQLSRGGGTAVICRGNSARPVQLAAAGIQHPFVQPQAVSHGIHVEILSDGHPVHGALDFPSPSAACTAPLPSSMYQARPSADTVPALPAPVERSGYGLLPEEGDEIKEELPRCGMPAVSGWPDVSLEQPESSKTGATVDSHDFDEETKDQPLTDAYTEDGGPRGSDGHFDSRCFALDEAAAADQHWAPIRAVNPAIINVDHDRPDNFSHAQLAETAPGHASASVSVLSINNGRAFPMIIEPTSPPDSDIPTTNTGTAVEGYVQYLSDRRSAEYQLPCETESEEQLQGSGGEAEMAVRAGTTPPSQSTGTAACLDLGSDFADLLGTQHSDEFDYHLNYVHAVQHDQRPQPLRQKTRRSIRSQSKSHDAGPPRKSSKRESADH